MSHKSLKKTLLKSYSVVSFLKNGKNKSLLLEKSITNPIITSALNGGTIEKEINNERI
tara:strand:- start:470 stop:643 length:174 start_codon:yes stop_codon:yes gene_type:complete